MTPDKFRSHWSDDEEYFLVDYRTSGAIAKFHDELMIKINSLLNGSK
jgi:hypothetical protein